MMISRLLLWICRALLVEVKIVTRVTENFLHVKVNNPRL